MLLLVGCAAAPLKLYTLGGPSVVSAAPPLGTAPTVIQVQRVSLPDYLDTEDILVRRGSTLEPSHLGRWATRLSLGITDLITARLAQRRPDALVTDQQQSAAAAYRVVINISRLDVTGDGAAAVEADWQIVPRDPAGPIIRDRAHFTASGSVADDQAVVALDQGVLEQLADAIDISRLR